MDFQIRAMKPGERLYTYQQSQQICGQCGGIGYLRGDFGRGGEDFYSTWEDSPFSKRFITDEFKGELDEVINALRFSEAGGGLFQDRASMLKYCRAQPDSAFQGNYCTEYGFRVDSEKYAYLIRCNPVQGDYNLYVFPYVKDWLDSHMEKAAQGIRFIDSNYQELFRIPDGGKITLVYDNGEINTRTCRFIDECHTEVGNNLYHICEFAERMERNGSVYAPEPGQAADAAQSAEKRKKGLPVFCFSTLPSNGTLIVVKNGEAGYYPSRLTVQGKSPREVADFANEKTGVTKAQEAAMLAGSLFGWDCKAADPRNYDKDGNPKKPQSKRRQPER